MRCSIDRVYRLHGGDTLLDVNTEACRSLVVALARFGAWDDVCKFNCFCGPVVCFCMRVSEYVCVCVCASQIRSISVFLEIKRYAYKITSYFCIGKKLRKNSLLLCSLVAMMN